MEGSAPSLPWQATPGIDGAMPSSPHPGLISQSLRTELGADLQEIKLRIGFRFV